MKDQKHNLPERLIRGKTPSSQEAHIPITGGQGKIATNLKDIHWTPIKLSIVSIVILSPISFAIVLSFKSGNILVGIILIALLIFMGLIYLALRYIDQNEF